MLTLEILLPILAATSTIAVPILSTRQDRTSTGASVIDARWDGSCFYPEPDDDFDLEDYLGRWYQIAGTPAPFTAGCTCIYAEYSLNDNGTVSVQNGCQLNDQPITIQGTATTVDEAYGDEGVFQVSFPGQPEPECPGPNYIVQDFDEDDGFAIVQASNFSTLFLLSREAVVEDSVVDRWLQRAERRGSRLDGVVRTDQTGCVYTD